MKYYKFHFFISLILLFLFVVFFLLKIDTTLDVNVYHTYFVFDYATFFMLFGQWFALIGFGYFILHRLKIKMVSSLQLAHLVGSLIILIPLCFPKWFRIEEKRFPSLGASEKIYYQYDESAIFFFAFLIFIAFQLLYFMNILISTIRTKKS